MVCHYSYFFCGFIFQNFVYNGFHDFTILCPSLRDVAIITVKDVDYSCVIHGISNSKPIHLLRIRGCIYKMHVKEINYSCQTYSLA